MTCRTCENCPFGGVKVSHRGPIDSPLVIVGDSLSPFELAKKTVFAGETGLVISQMLKASGFADLGVEPLFINAIECFVPDKTTGRKKVVDPKSRITMTVDGGKQKYAQALRNCRNRLMDVIAQHPRRMIISLGAGPLQSLTNDYSKKIMAHRGGLIQDGLSEKGTFVTLHPFTILKGGGSLQQYQDDFKNAYAIYEDGIRPKYYNARHVVLKTPAQVLALCKLLRRHGNNPVAADIETGGFDFWKDEILELGVSMNGKFVYIIPDELIIPELFQNKCQWVWHNGKFDIKFLWAYDVAEARVDHDTMLMSYILDEVKGIHGLEQVAWDWLGAPDYKDVLKPYLPNKDTSYREIPADIRRKYLADDVSRTFQLFDPMLKAVKADADSKKCYDNILIPGSNYLARVEWNGFKTDRAWVKAHMDEMESEIKKHEEDFQKIAIETWGKEVNTNSPKQLQDYLYRCLKLAHPDQSTDKKTLESLPPHPALEPLLKIRKLQKYLSTYIYPCWNKVDYDGRIHAAYNLHGTKTGRLSSNGPNMQNIPRLKAVRGMFMAEEGKILIECDLSQAELRSLAQLSGDDELCRIYNSNELSLHDEVTAEIFPQYTLPETPPEEKKELKMRGKAVNFGIVYGRQAFSFVAEFAISLTEAQRWIEKWFVRFPKARAYIEKCRDAVVTGKTLRTIFGRKRRFGAVTQERIQKLQNEASNFPHQSTASDITLLAGIRCEPLLRVLYNAKVVNTVHDCIVIEAEPQYKDAICRMVTESLKSIPREWGMRRVPFEAESEIGERWGHLAGYHDYLHTETAGESEHA